MKNKLPTFRNLVIVTVFILSSVSIIGQTHSGLASTENNAGKNQSLPVINFFAFAQTTDTLAKMIADFNANYSISYGFTVELRGETIGQPTDNHDIYLNLFHSNSTFYDVFTMPVTWTDEFAPYGYLLPVNNVFNASYQAQFLQADVNASVDNGKIYSVPWFHNSGMLYYRSDILQYAFNNGIIPDNRPPQTWSELMNWTLAMMQNNTLVTKYNLTSGFVWQGRSYEGLMCELMEYLGATGTYTYLTSQQVNTTFETSSGIRDALTYMRSLITSGASPQSVLTFDEEGSRAVWNSGKAIFMRNWPYAYALSLNSPYLNGSLVLGTEHNQRQFNVTSMPAANATMASNGLARTSCIGGYQLAVNAFSRYPEQAKKFIMWLTASQQQTTYFLGNGYLPTIKILYNSPTILNSKQSYVHTFLPIFESSIARPISPIYQNISNALVPTINNYLAGHISLDTAINTMSSIVKSISNNALGTISPNETATITKNLPGEELFSVLSVIFLALEIVFKKRKMNS